jgi:hypothetical protein
MTDRTTQWALAAFAVVIAFVLILAFWGYLTGAWQALE